MENEDLVTVFKSELRSRFVKGFLDVLILQLVEVKPLWGYEIIKRTMSTYEVKLRHGALYPMLKSLEEKGLLRSKKELHKGRSRKIYEITPCGKQLLDTYYGFIGDQLPHASSRKN